MSTTIQVQPADVLTPTEAMTYLRISRGTFFKLLRENHLPRIKVSERKTFVSREAVERLMQPQS
jgi:excisionase family DNA binding protein